MESEQQIILSEREKRVLLSLHEQLLAVNSMNETIIRNVSSDKSIESIKAGIGRKCSEICQE